MKVTIRRSTFETNSSSMHSLVIKNDEGEFTPEEIKRSFGRLISDKGIVHMYRSEDSYWEKLVFERYPFEVLYTFYQKLRYLIATVHNDEDVKEIEAICKEVVPRFKAFKFDTSIKKSKYYYAGEEYGSVNSETCLSDKLAAGLSFRDFLMKRRYVIIVDGDEYCEFEHLKDANLIVTDQPILQLQAGECVCYSNHNIVVLDNNRKHSKKEITGRFFPNKGILDFWYDGDLLFGETNFKVIHTFYDKCCYALASYSHNPDKVLEIEETIKEMDSRIKVITYGRNRESLRSAYIDHLQQWLLDDFITSRKITLKDFLINKKYIVIINGVTRSLDRLVECQLLSNSKILDIVGSGDFEGDEY